MRGGLHGSEGEDVRYVVQYIAENGGVGERKGGEGVGEEGRGERGRVEVRRKGGRGEGRISTFMKCLS